MIRFGYALALACTLFILPAQLHAQDEDPCVGLSQCKSVCNGARPCEAKCEVEWKACRSQPAPQTPPGSSRTVTVAPSRSKEAVQSAFSKTIPAGNPFHTSLRSTIIVGDYAIQEYTGDIGGSATLKY